MRAPRPRPLAKLALTVLLHAGLLYAVLQGPRRLMPDRPRGPAIQWLLAPRPPSPAVPRQQTQAVPAPQPAMPISIPLTFRPAAAAVTPAPASQRSEPAAGSSASAQPVPEPTTAGKADDPFALETSTLPAPASASDLLQRARQDAGRADRALRAADPQRLRLALPPPDSMQARLERGINAAHEAVPPKWYQGARMVELSTADGERKTRTYKIITAIGSYCININPEGRRSYTSCP